jgi:indole-3-glycerol phosphate synthase
MSILKKIIETKKQEVAVRKTYMPEEMLRDYEGFRLKCNSLKTGLQKPGSTGIIAEYKQRSPSLGNINLKMKPELVTRKYVEAGATGISVLTDEIYFGGSTDDLEKARRANPEIPLLRKDFMIDTYQITESKAFGADVILLIAACLEKEEAEILAKKAKELGMEVLLEIHNAAELEKINDFIDIIGVNNRNLSDFNIDIKTSEELAGLIPGRFLKISESGIKDSEVINHLRQYGYDGFLIGSAFMASENPGEACKKFISEL